MNAHRLSRGSHKVRIVGVEDIIILVGVFK